MARRRRTIGRIFAVPLVIAGLSTIGLISALAGDGIWDGISWLALLVPIVLCGWLLLPIPGRQPGRTGA